MSKTKENSVRVHTSLLQLKQLLATSGDQAGSAAPSTCSSFPPGDRKPTPHAALLFVAFQLALQLIYYHRECLEVLSFDFRLCRILNSFFAQPPALRIENL